MLGSNTNFTDIKALKAWNSAQVVPGYDSRLWRKDYAGSWIKFSEYNNSFSNHGWKKSKKSSLTAVNIKDEKNYDDAHSEYGLGTKNAFVAISVILLATLGLVL